MATKIEHDGKRLNLTAPSGGVKSDDLVILNHFVGIALNDAGAGETFVLVRDWLATLPKATGESWNEGDPIYWDATNKVATISDGAGANRLIGGAAKAAASSDSTGKVASG